MNICHENLTFLGFQALFISQVLVSVPKTSLLNIYCIWVQASTYQSNLSRAIILQKKIIRSEYYLKFLLILTLMFFLTNRRFWNSLTFIYTRSVLPFFSWHVYSWSYQAMQTQENLFYCLNIAPRVNMPRKNPLLSNPLVNLVNNILQRFSPLFLTILLY